MTVFSKDDGTIPHFSGFEWSTITQLNELTHDFSSIINGNDQVDVIFLDFRKVFDKVNQRKLILKL